MEKAEKVMNQLYKLGFILDRSYYDAMLEERIFLMSRRGKISNQLIEVDEQGLVCGQNINEFLKSI
tara:strand:- start:162 stop:359 length:198 start_codon:yes stop_codon:yes gene_type:complete